MSDTKTLAKLYWDELAKEGISKSDIELIDLNIAFEPVTPFKGAEPCEVLKTIGGKYIVIHPLCNNPVDTEELKIMRYRYLQFDPERVKQRESIRRMFKNHD